MSYRDTREREHFLVGGSWGGLWSEGEGPQVVAVCGRIDKDLAGCWTCDVVEVEVSGTSGLSSSDGQGFVIGCQPSSIEVVAGLGDFCDLLLCADFPDVGCSWTGGCCHRAVRAK